MDSNSPTFGKSPVRLGGSIGVRSELTRGTFENPTNIGVAVSGQAVPYTEDFPDGVKGHLRVVFKIWGDDAWRIGDIESAVIEGAMSFIPDTIDSWKWTETRHPFYFGGEDVLSTRSDEGILTLTLNY